MCFCVGLMEIIIRMVINKMVDELGTTKFTKKQIGGKNFALE